MSIKVNVRPVKGHKVYNYRVTYPDGGKRRSKGFKMRKDAEAWAKDKRDEITATGTGEESITKEERRAVMMFRDAMADLSGEVSDATLTGAVNHYLEHIGRSHKSMTCLEVTSNLIDRLYKLELSKRHIDTTKSRLKHFNAEYGDRMARDISKEIIKDYLDHLNVAPVTRKNAKLTLSGLFSQAIRDNAADENPVKGVELARVKRKKPGILTPEELASYLASAEDRVIPAIALSFFAGIRRAEIERLDWGAIDFEEGEIYISDEIAKDHPDSDEEEGKDRYVEISDNLRAWLLPHAKKRGLVVQSEQIHRTGIDKARDAAGIKRPKNAGRHSFASYHLAQHRHAGETAIQLGHPNPKMLEKHYKSAVKGAKKRAEMYWSIVPEKASNITDMKAS